MCGTIIYIPDILKNILAQAQLESTSMLTWLENWRLGLKTVKGYWGCAALTDYNGVTFLVELLEWGRTFLGFLR